MCIKMAPANKIEMEYGIIISVCHTTLIRPQFGPMVAYDWTMVHDLKVRSKKYLSGPQLIN